MMRWWKGLLESLCGVPSGADLVFLMLSILAKIEILMAGIFEDM